MGLRPTKGGENAPFQQLLSPEAPPSPLSSRPEKSWAFGPPKVMKTGPVQQLLLLEAPPSPLSSRPELRRSVVERSAVSAVRSWKCFSLQCKARQRDLGFLLRTLLELFVSNFNGLRLL